MKTGKFTVYADKETRCQRVQYYHPRTGSRTTKSIGKVKKGFAEEFCMVGNRLASVYDFGGMPDSPTLQIVSGWSAQLQEKMWETGYLPGERFITMIELQEMFLDDYEYKERSKEAKTNQTKHVVNYLGASSLVAGIRFSDLDDFRGWLIGDEVKGKERKAPSRASSPKLAKVTANNAMSAGRSMFAKAMEKRILTENPLEHAKSYRVSHQEKLPFTPEEVDRLFDSCTMSKCKTATATELQALLALYRWGALRYREPSYLKWSDCVWKDGIAGGELQQIKIFDYKRTYIGCADVFRHSLVWHNLLPYLMKLYEERDPGEDYLFAGECNRFHHRKRFWNLLRTVCRAAGLTRGPKKQLPKDFFSRFRTTGSREIALEHGTVVENAMVGHSEGVRRQHYDAGAYSQEEAEKILATGARNQPNGAGPVQVSAPVKRIDWYQAVAPPVFSRDTSTLQRVQMSGCEQRRITPPDEKPQENNGEIESRAETGATTGAIASKSGSKTKFTTEEAKAIFRQLLEENPEVLKELLK